MACGIFKAVCWFLQAGNVVTGEMVEELILSGADIIKVGIGPGGWVGAVAILHRPQTQMRRKTETYSILA